MQKGRQRIFGIAVLVALLVAGGLYYFVSQLDRLVAAFIEEQGSEATGTAVNVAGVAITLPEASGAIRRLSVANPEGFPGNALELERFTLGLDAVSLTADPLIIENVEVQGARLNVLQQGVTNNLVHLQLNLSRSGSDRQQAGQEPGRNLLIRRFTMTDVSVLVSVPDLAKQARIDIPPITLTDIGGASNGVPGAEIARQILEPVINQALRTAAAQSLQDEVEQQLDNARNQLLEGLREQLGDGNETDP